MAGGGIGLSVITALGQAIQMQETLPVRSQSIRCAMLVGSSFSDHGKCVLTSSNVGKQPRRRTSSGPPLVMAESMTCGHFVTSDERGDLAGRRKLRTSWFGGHRPDCSGLADGCALRHEGEAVPVVNRQKLILDADVPCAPVCVGHDLRNVVSDSLFLGKGGIGIDPFSPL